MSTFNHNDKFFITSSGNVGVGTASPTSQIHVTSAPANGVYLSYLYNSGTHNSSHGLNVQTASNNIATYGLRVNTGGDSNALAVMGTGTVGVGTHTGTAKLEIAGGSLASGTVTNLGISTALTTGRTRAYDSGSLASVSVRGDSSSLELVAGSSATWYTGIGLTARNATAASGTIIGYTSGVEKFRVDAEGDFGIGTTNPLYKLHVRSTAANDDVCYIHHDSSSQSDSTTLKVRSDGGDSSGYYLLDVSNGTGSAFTLTGSRIPTFTNSTASGTALYLYNDTNSIADTKTLIDFRAQASDNSNFYVSGQMGSKAEGTWTSTSSTRDASLIFNTVQNGNNHTALTLNSDKNAYFEGNIYGMSVNGASSKLYRVGGIFFTWDSDSYGTQIQHSITSTLSGTYTDDLTINSYSSVRVNIDTNNNDGNSTFSIGHHGTGSSGNLFMVNESGNTYIDGKGIIGDAANAAAQLHVATDTVANGGTKGADVLTLIGTSETTSTSGTVTPTNPLVFKPAMPAGYTDDGYSWVIEQQTGANRTLYLGTSGSGALSLSADGEITSTKGSSAVRLTEHSSGAAIWMDGSNGDFTGGDYFGIHAYGTDKLTFSYAGTSKITMLDTGKLGIGTDSPTYTLQVQGTGYFNETVYINGTTTVDADLKVTGTSEDTFIIGPQAAGSGTILMSLNAAENAYEPLRVDAELFRITASGNTSAYVMETSGLHSTFGGNITGKGYLNLSNGYGSSNGLYLNGNPAVWREDADNLRFPLDVARFNEIVTTGNQNGNNNGSGAPGRYATGVLDLSHSGTPSNYRIETNIPFNSSGADFTIHIEGFRYGGRDPVSLIICWHIYPANTPYNHCVISNGGWSPVVKIARNTANNLTTLFIESPGYWPKMYVRSIHSSNYEIGAYAKGWTWSDATLASGYDIITTIPYQPLSLGSGGISNVGNITGLTGNLDTPELSINDYVKHNGNTDAFFGFPTTNTFSVGTGGSERARIDNAGRFFLGHTSTLLSSSEKFSVSAGTNGINVFQNSSTGNGTLYLSNTNTSTTDWQTYLIFQDGTGNRAQFGNFYNDSKLGISGHGGIAFKTGATSLASATTRLTITSSGSSVFEGDITVENPSSSHNSAITIKGYEPRLNITKTRGSSGDDHFRISHENDSSAVDFSLSQNGGGFVRTARIGSTNRWVIGGYEEVNSAQLSVQGHLGVQGTVYITGDGSNSATLTESSAGILTIATVDDFRVDAGGDITLDADGNDVRFKNNAITYGYATDESQNYVVGAGVQDKDIIFRGNDGGTLIDALTLDMSEGGNATFAGNVGIGASPATNLHVSGTTSYGSIRISPTSANGESAIAFFLDTAGTTTGTAWVAGHAGWGHTNDFVIGNQTFGGPVMLLQTNGYVGIGNTSPQRPLSVKSNSDSPIMVESTDDTTGIIFKDNNSSNALYYRGNGNYFYTTSKFGIGTTNPGSKLEVITTGTNSVVELDNSTANYTLTQYNAQGVTKGFSGFNDSFMLFGGESGTDTRLQAGGQYGLTVKNDTRNVGIGTTSPSSKLHVSGANTVGRFTSSSSYVDLIFENSSGTGGFLNFNGTSSFNVYVGGGSGSNLEMSLTNAGLLTVSGDVVAFGSPSDASLKENVKPIDNALDKVTKLKGVTFDWKQSDSILDIKEDIGFIAQDVRGVLPELVRTNKDGKLSLRDKGIIPVLVEAIKELKAEIEELKCKCDGCTK